MPLPLTVSCFSKIQTGFTFLVPAHPGSPGQRAVKWVCVCGSARYMKHSGLLSGLPVHWSIFYQNVCNSLMNTTVLKTVTKHSLQHSTEHSWSSNVKSTIPTLRRLFCDISHTHTHTHTQPFNGLLSGTTKVGQYQKKHSPTHTHPHHRTSFIIFLHLQWSMASSFFSLRAWQSSRTTSLQVLFGLPLGLGPSTSYSMHFFTKSSSSSFHSTCPYQRSLFCYNTNAMSSIPSLSLSSLLGSIF